MPKDVATATLAQNREKHSRFGKDAETVQRLERAPNARDAYRHQYGQTKNNGFAPARSQIQRRECTAFPKASTLP
jgi:hypothetical protein